MAPASRRNSSRAGRLGCRSERAGAGAIGLAGQDNSLCRFGDSLQHAGRETMDHGPAAGVAFPRLQALGLAYCRKVGVSASTQPSPRFPALPSPPQDRWECRTQALWHIVWASAPSQCAKMCALLGGGGGVVPLGDRTGKLFGCGLLTSERGMMLLPLHFVGI